MSEWPLIDVGYCAHFDACEERYEAISFLMPILTHDRISLGTNSLRTISQFLF
jgi:hypothetical protein